MVGEERKLTAFAEACNSVGVSFIPVAPETLKGWSEKESWAPRGTEAGYFTCQLYFPFIPKTLRVFRGNASMWVRCTPINSAEIDSVV